ncbi:hypothetical protein B0T26DRAFT_638131 [Lasiosphaeria miniovina]|uniref:Thymidylate kinase n=1 Tax=Lasiosphaeria miniovina TaxID=1954250 RepID=A0AA40B6Y3_9PEZI|nr:uncharacterized protein B0T26DRAFT_638131 [Lasiosphaeria miniovina]KAK0728804.1 hypothetical protein B0T26DRAFT_638131 [Lasiosphaeria miniovina]
MATLARQPFAPLDGARLQTLTSLKNRQNGTAPVKRKASEVLDADDFENVDPSNFSKRSKGAGAASAFSKDFFKPSSFVLTKATSAPSLPVVKDVHSSAPSKIAPTRPRSMLQPKSPAARLNTSITTSSSLTAPAGRSPTRGSKRIGILSRRRTQRVDPPSFSLGAVPFSLDAALKGTIPSYTGSHSKASSDLLAKPEMKSSWFFEIHEDTPEQEMTNLLQHSTCTLDISSDEESEKRARRDNAEGRDKENIPPSDDVSQTSARAARATAAGAGFDDMIVEKQRGPLVEMNAADYYADGCDYTSVILVPGDDEEAETRLKYLLADDTFEFAPKVQLADLEAVSVDVIMGKDDPAAKAAVLQPIDGTGESFELWESGSAKDEVSPPPSPAPMAAEDVPEAFSC